jgi:5'-deoxynucleotidase YfbR-like HD superfamily hydrolase
MKDEHPRPEHLSTEEQRLIQQLRKRPQLMERFNHILEIANDTEGPIKTADEVEALLIEEMRRLGNATMQGWGEQVEQRLGEQLKQKHGSAVVRKKKR